MKILHKSKRTAPPHPQVTEIIVKLLKTSSEDLPEVLAQINSWKWPRSDLNAWIKVLNKFDAIFEHVIHKYDIDKLQINAFDSITKKTVCEILRFERLLLENSTNRKLFSSYDRINSLLLTSDLDVLVLSLHLLLRPSQQYSAQPAVTSALNISTPRLKSLAKRWPSLREHDVSLVDLVSHNGRSTIEGLPSEAREVNFTFYRTDEKTAGGGEGSMETQEVETLESTPRKPTAAPITTTTSSGAVNVHIDQLATESQNEMKILAEVIEKHSVPDEEKFELLCRIRAAAVLAPGKHVEREKLVIVRLLAIAIFGHTHSEASAMSSLFLYEPDLIPHLAELLQLDRGVSVMVQTAAISALDALARYRNKIQEVLTAINAGVNHGILMALVRKTVADIADPECKLPHSFVEALLTFVTYTASHQAGGNMVVGAGLVPLLVQVIGNTIPERLAVVSKTMQLVDNVLFSFANAFQLFCNGRGVEALVDRIEYEIDLDIKEHGDRVRGAHSSYGELPVARAAVLKHTLRSMHRMMQSSGTAEGLRGLIDSSVLKSLKKVIENRSLFGPSVVPIAINIMATFVHNEPTSLPVIQEAGLPEAFYKAIEAGLEPVIEVIQAIPNAIGALCLNQAGQDQLAGRPSIIPGIFAIFTSERHLKVLQEKENAVLIGTAIDELIRHHPSLKAAVFESIKSTMGKIEDMGNTHAVGKDIEHWYKLLPISSSASDMDICIDYGDSGATPRATMPTEQADPDDIPLSGDESMTKPHDNTVVSFIDVIGRFLEGLFQTPSHCKDFINNTDGMARIGRFTALPCIPYDYANSLASDSLVQIMRNMTDVAPNETLAFLQNLVKSSLAETQDFWGTMDDHSKLLPLLDVTEQEYEESNRQFRKLITLHIRVALLSDVFSTAGYAHGRAAIGILQVLMGSNAQDAVPGLGTLHRACIWEGILLKAGLASRGIETASSPDGTTLDEPTALPPPNISTNSASGTTNGIQQESVSREDGSDNQTSTKQIESAREQNAKALQHLTHGLPSALAPFFQAIVKLFHARRNPDPVQRKQIMGSASNIAQVMLKHISEKSLDPGSDVLTSSAYFSIMLGTITVLLVDGELLEGTFTILALKTASERTAQPTVHTVLLSEFYRAGGLEAISKVCRSFITTIEQMAQVEDAAKSESQKQELAHAYGGLKVALRLIHTLISSKALQESAQTLLMNSRDKKDTDPNYFESHNFLVRVRLALLPLLKEMWEAPWLVPAPIGVVKSVVQAVMEIMAGESEESGDDAPALDITRGPPVSRPVGPDENRIRQLTDMGFPRSAAERALTRMHNNVNAATELLLSQPFPLAPDPAPASDEEPSEDAAEEEVEAEDDEMQVEVAPTDPLTPPAPGEETKSSEQWLKELNAARDPLTNSIPKQALQLVDAHPSLIFDVSSAFTRPSDTMQEQSARLLVDDIKIFSPHAHGVKEEPLAMRCRLLALVLSEAPSSLTEDLGANLMDSLLALLLSNPPTSAAEHSSIPKWLAAHLLVTEALLAMGEQPLAITLPKENEPIPTESISTTPSYPEARTIIFDYCLRVLTIADLPRDEFLAVLRLLVILTQEHSAACQLVQRDGVARIFGRLKSSPVAGSQSYVAIILRHVIEDSSVLQQIMKQEIKHFFSQPRTRILDVGNYLRHCSAMALRNPQIFVQATKSLCKLQTAYSNIHHVSLKDDIAARQVMISPDTASSDMQVDGPLPTPLATASPESLEILVHYLIGELMRVSKPLSDSQVTSTISTGQRAEVKSSSTDLDPTSTIRREDGQDQDQHLYACFIMQCLTELLFSYDSCKVALLSYAPKKRNQTPMKEGPAKYRMAVLQFLLSDLVSFGGINAPSDPGSQNRHLLCNWAMSIVVALCVDTSAGSEVKDVSPELISVRKFVLEAVSRAIKDVFLSGSLDSRYGRLLALSDLCHRLLTVRFNAVIRKSQDETPTHIAKVMLEKNFVATLTNALAEVDLNYPNVRSLVAGILRPLEHLTKIAIKMSRASDKAKDSAGDKPESVGSLASDEDDEIDEEDEDEEAEDQEREETPDLYRNSALGMLEMEDVNYAPEDEMDEDVEDDDEDAEMDFGEETGSDDTSNTDEEEEILDADVRESQEGGWQDEDEEYEEDDLIEQEDDDDDDDGDGEDEGAPGPDVEAEMIWPSGDVAPDGPDQDDDEEGEGPVEIPVMHQEHDEPEMLSDDEEYGNDVGVLSIDGGPPGDDIFGFAGLAAEGAQEPPFIVSRRTRAAGDDMQVFGRVRNTSITPAEATTHPLLLDASAASNRAGGLPRLSRRVHRAHQGTSHSDVLQTITDIIGAPAVQLISHIVSHGHRGPGEAIRVDVPPGALVELDRGLMQRRSGVSAVRVDRGSRSGDGRPESPDFDPQLTLQRWGDEVKTLHGKFVSERVGKLANHVILALLPEAAAAAKEAKEKEDKRRAAEAEAEAAAAKEEREKAEAEAEEKRAAGDEIKEVDGESTIQKDSEMEGETSTAPEIPEQTATASVQDADTEMADASLEPNAEPVEGPSSTEAAASQPTERVTVMIHGSAVDITDTGIDPTFLEALPDEMREEVLNQHVRDQRAARIERPADSQISDEFLDALPPEIRAEIIQQERLEQTRRRQEDRRQDQPAAGSAGAGASVAIPTDMDPASFIASLDPQLRQTVLLDSDDAFVRSLPPFMIAEIDSYRDGAQASRRHVAASGATGTRPPVATRKVQVPRDAIQLVDKTGVAVLVRLLFFPQVLRKNHLFKVLLNLCENTKTKVELFNLLLNILQDGTGDLTAVDKSFAQMSVRTPKTPSQQTPKASSKLKTGSDYFSSLALPNIQNEANPELVAQRCLEALTYIVGANELSSLFFLTEHELPPSLRRFASKKGKGKEKQAPQMHYPVVLLLGLLERQALLRTPSTMESVVGLLAIVTRPLTSLKDAKTRDPEAASAEPSSSILPSATQSPPTSAAEGEISRTDIDSSVSAAPTAEETPKEAAVPAEADADKALLTQPPQIPHAALRLIVNILTVGECSGRTFQQSLALIQNLSYIPDARDVVAQELKSKAQEFGQGLYVDLDELAAALQSSRGDALAGSVASKFSPASSIQAKLLRVLKTIDYMYSSKSAMSVDESRNTGDAEKVQGIYESFRFTPLWRRLGDCLAVIEEKPDTEHIATVLLPLIEALMVVCKYVGSKPLPAASARALRASASPRSPTTPKESMEDLFVSFTDAHRKVLNLMVRNNPSLMSGSFSLLVNNPRVLDFDNKRNYFTQQLHRRPHSREHHTTLQLNVRRARVFEDSFQYLQRKTGDQIKHGKLSIRFYDEEGVDAGGVTREWFQILARQMFDPNNALFQPCAADRLTYQPNKNSWVNPEHLSFFKFVGRVIGKAIYDGRLLDAYFAKSLYRQLLGKQVDYKDVEWVDPEYYNSLCWILENDPTALDLTFSVEADEFGVSRIAPLKEGGETLPVTNDNKREFVQLSAQYRLYSSIKEQIESLLAGFYEIIPKDLVTIFNEQELELLISGTPDIDVDEWRAATEYNGYNSSDPVIVWWWRALKSFNRDERAKVLSFATGTSRVPLSGFVDLQGVQGVQRFSIHRAYGESDRLPQAHTCFNQIDLPQYTSYEMLRQQLLLAINEGGEGFGFA
ncbi:hypothetical protein HWV62_31363 [Athelia sp. TMB]|nr:hypothetical protein HWV62_31363 [Athelia sp. TMB]